MPPRQNQPAEGKAPVKVENAGSANESTTQATPDNSSTIVTDPTPPANAPMTAPPSSGSSVPPKRLGSLSRPSSSTTTARGRGSTTIAKPKFVGRRSQAARAELEKEEAKKKAAEAEAEAHGRDRKSNRFGQGASGGRGARDRGRGGRGRGRGGFMGEAHRPKDVPIASGPFGSGQVGHDARFYSKRPSWGGGVGGGGGGGGGSGAFGGGGGPSSGASSHGRNGAGARGPGGVKFEGDDSSGMGRMRSVKTEDGGYISSDDEDYDGVVLKKQNIDELQSRAIDLTGEDDEDDNDAFAPVRLKRVPVKDRKVGLGAEELSKRPTEYAANADIAEDTSAKKKGKARVQDIEITGSSAGPKRATAYSSSSDAEDATKIKQEVMDEDDPQLASVQAATLTSLHDNQNIEGAVLPDVPFSPESKRKAKEQVKASVAQEIDDDEEEDFKRPKTPPYPTQQEIDEFHRHWDDLRVIHSELGRVGSKPVPAEESTDTGSDVKMNDDTSAPVPVDAAMAKSKGQQTLRSDQVYLFQFPPVLPDLSPVNAKPDPEAQAAANGNGASTEARSVKAADTTTNPQPHLASGAVGKLRVHKSGKATLDWGGTSFVLGMGTESTFLQNILIANVPETKPNAGADAPSDNAARAMGMGQVRGKFVLTPNWEDILS